MRKLKGILALLLSASMLTGCFVLDDEFLEYETGEYSESSDWYEDSESADWYDDSDSGNDDYDLEDFINMTDEEFETVIDELLYSSMGDEGYWYGCEYDDTASEDYYAVDEKQEYLPEDMTEYLPDNSDMFTESVASDDTEQEHDSQNSGSTWDDVPVFSDRASLNTYLRDCLDYRMTEIAVRCENGYQPDARGILNDLNLPWLNHTVVYNDGSEMYVIYKTVYYPGTRVADAYLSGDTSGLSADELQLYSIAVQLVNEAKQMPTNIHAELYLHDQICESVKYYTEETRTGMPRYCTALGVFLDGKANCQGYADAFYMLGTMYGFNVDKLSGIANGGGHVWNIIENNSVWYSVDVCWNDDNFSANNVDYVQYTYFNAPVEIIGTDHSWTEYATSLPLQQTLDTLYFYWAPEGVDNTYFGRNADTMYAAAVFCGQMLAQGDTNTYIMAPYDSYYDTIEEISAVINNTLNSYGVVRTYRVFIKTVGSYSYMYVELAG